MKHCLLHLFLMLPLATSIHAQEYSFVHYPFDPDPEAATGNVLYQDKYHRLWIGTSHGLRLFDGIQYTHDPLPSGPADISAITMDDGYTLWLGTSDGKIYHGVPGLWNSCGSSSEIAIRDLVATKSDRIWAATYGNGIHVACEPAQTGILAGNDIYSMFACAQGNLWIATDGGIVVLNAESGEEVREVGKSEGLEDPIIISLTSTPDGLVWAGAFEKGICAIDSATITYPFSAWEYGPVLQMTAVDNFEIWISTERHGLLRYDRLREVITPVQIPGNSNPAIADLLLDAEGNLWLLDRYKGLYRTQRRFETYPAPLEGIQSLAFDHAGNAYAGHATGLYLLSPDFTSASPVLEQINVLSMYEDVRKNFWAGTFGQGLYCRPAGSKTWFHYTKDNGLTDESIFSITGVHDTLWLATLGGVTRIELHGPLNAYELDATNYNLADGLGTNFIYTAKADNRGRIWFGTDGKGLSVLEGGNIRNFQAADTIPLHAVYSITETSDGQICFVTDRAGVFCFDGATFRMIPLPPALQDQEIASITADPLGNLLLAHAGGVDLMTSDQSTIRFSDRRSDVLAPNLNASATDAQGQTWIAGQQTILCYHPLRSTQGRQPLNLLTNVRVFLDPVDVKSQHAFTSKQNYLTFEYLGLWYTSPRDVTYRYQVEGLDPGWNETRERAVTYQHIPPGDYRFILESTCSGEFNISNRITYSFSIGKPFYLTTGFLTGMTALLGFMIWFVFRLRERNLKKAAQLKRKQVESELQTLKAQINPHFLFNSFNTLASVIEDDPKMAVEYVENLSDFYRSILQYREKNLITLREEIEIVRSYAYILQKRFGPSLQIHLPEGSTDVFVVPMVLQILVENAVKHNVISERKPLEITIRLKEDDTILVENTLQPKQASRASTGFGLQSIISRYALLSNRSVVTGQTQHVFFVVIPALRYDEVPDT